MPLRGGGGAGRGASAGRCRGRRSGAAAAASALVVGAGGRRGMPGLAELGGAWRSGAAGRRADGAVQGSRRLCPRCSPAAAARRRTRSSAPGRTVAEARSLILAYLSVVVFTCAGEPLATVLGWGFQHQQRRPRGSGPSHARPPRPPSSSAGATVPGLEPVLAAVPADLDRPLVVDLAGL